MIHTRRPGWALAVLLLAAGCSHPTTPPSPKAAVLADPTRAASSAATRLQCMANLTLGPADNGRTVCVRRGGQVTVGLVAPDHSAYAEVDASNGALVLLALPMPFGYFAFRAAAPGTAVLTATHETCFGGGTGTCPPLTPWSVTVVVR